MTPKASIRILQMVLAVVLCGLSVELVATQLQAGHRGITFFVFLVLGIVEAAGAVLFFSLARLGGTILLATFATAAAIHLLHGQISHLGILAIYAAAVWAVMQSRTSLKSGMCNGE